MFRRYEGPLTVLEKVGKVSYKLDTKPWMKMHPVFHVSNLRPYRPDKEDASRNEDKRPPMKGPRSKKITKEVDTILADRYVKIHHKWHWELLVKWKDEGDEESTWERAEDLEDFKHKIEEFKEASRHLPSTSTTPAMGGGRVLGSFDKGKFVQGRK